jgi:hypothetical protein
MRRQYLTASRLAELEQSLSVRDRGLIDSLDRLRVATTAQLTRLHFDDLTEGSAARQTTQTLRRLKERSLVTHLDRQVGGVRAGSAATIWSLDRAGQKLASSCGPAGGMTCRRPWTPGLPFLAHRLAVSECYVELVEACRSKHRELLEFDAEPYCWRRFAAPLGGVAWLKPDAFARLLVGEFERGAFVEIDRDTESPSTLKRKLASYRHYWETGREQERRGYFPEVVWSVPSEARKQVLIDLCAAQPEDVWPLFRVVLAPDLSKALLRGEAP